MIDVSPFMERLEWLKEWMDTMISHQPDAYWPGKNPRSMCGFVIVHHRVTSLVKYSIHSFQDYCNYKQSLSKTNQQ